MSDRFGILCLKERINIVIPKKHITKVFVWRCSIKQEFLKNLYFLQAKIGRWRPAEGR